MDSNQLVEAVRYLLEVRQAELLQKADRSRVVRSELTDELLEVEEMVEQAREGWEEL